MEESKPCILLLNDIHVSKDNIPAFQANWQEAVELCRKWGISEIAVGGDLFFSRAAQTLDVLLAVHDALLETSRAGIHVTLAEGNHDLVNQESVRGYCHVFDCHPDVTVVDDFLTLSRPGWEFALHLMSYFPEDGSFIERLEQLEEKALSEEKKHFLYIHEGINGALAQPSEKELPARIFLPFDKVFVGHYHNRTVIPQTRIEYIGASRQHNFGEDEEKGYTVLNSIFNAKVKLPFGITYQFNVAPRYQFFYERYFMSADLPGSNPNNRGADREHAKRFDWSLNNTITWDKIFDKKHHFIVTLAQEAEERQRWSDRIEARNIQPSDALGFHNTQNGSKESSSYSTTDSHETADGLLGRLFYSYDDRYMLTTSIRRDGYSAFGSTNPYAWFPSAAVAWTFSNEKFFQKFKNVMSSGKLRASYGSNGNRSLADPYTALANLSAGSGDYMGYLTSTGEVELMRYLMASRMANPTLQWEKTKSWNFALDFGFLNDRITGTMEFYTMNTNDMIMSQPLPVFTGFNNITTNLGQVNNTGFEFSLNTVNIKQKNFEWNTTFNFSYNKNKIKHLFYEYENVLDANGNVIGQKESDYTANGWFIGKPINQIWDYKVIGIWQNDEWKEAAKYKQQPGDPKVWNNPANDIYNADGSVQTIVYNDDDKQFLGTTTPPINWSLRNEFVLWKDLTVSINIYSRMGHKALSTNYLNNDDDGGRMSYAAACLQAKEYWTIDNPTNKYGRIDANGPDGAKKPGMLYNRSFIRLENIAVGYTLPRKLTQKWGIERVKISGTVRNVATWAKDWEYGDPETGGLGTRLYSLGLNLSF